MSTSTNLNLPFIAAGQAQKHVTHNEAIQHLDAIVQLSVESATLVAPPSGAGEGARYLVPAAATGAWAGRTGQIAVVDTGNWRFHVPAAGWLVWVRDLGRLRAYTGSAWVAPPAEDAAFAKLGINTTADTTNRLALSADASLFTHAGTGHQIKLNKAAASHTASLMFQTAFTGQAEIGTTGDDGLHIKTRSTASGWQERVFIDRETGLIGVGTTAPVVGAGTGTVIHLHAPAAATEWSVTRYTVGSESGAGDGLIVGNVGGTAYLWNYEATPLLIGTASATRIAVTGAGNVGIGTASPTCLLHVNGPVRTAQYTVAGLPSAATVGAGALVYVSNAAGGAVMAYSDGTIWRKVTDGLVVT